MLDDTTARRLHRNLRNLPEIYVHAWIALQGRRGTPGPRVSGGGRTPPLPVRANVLNLLGPAAPGIPEGPAEDQDDTWPITAVLDAWLEEVARGTRTRPQPHRSPDGRPEPRDITAARYLLHHHAWICEQPWAPNCAEQIDEAVRNLRATSGWQPARIRCSAPCPKCGQLTLIDDAGYRWVECTDRACGQLLSREEYEHHAETVARGR